MSDKVAMGDHVFKAIKDHDAKFLGLRFTDTDGRDRQVTVPVSAINRALFEEGKMFDGSSIDGWQEIHESDLILIPDEKTIRVDPFLQDTTLLILCNIKDPSTEKAYDRCPRSIAQKAENYLLETGIGDKAYFGPEPEFFLFDDVRWGINTSGSFYSIDSDEAHWNTSKSFDGGNIGHRPALKGGYLLLPPMDSSQDIRSAISLTCEAMGMRVEALHHEVATAGQCEVATEYASLLLKADHMRLFKYIVHNVAHNYGKTATFMPKPLVGDNGSGMHCHQSIAKNGVNLFAGDHYAGLSELALFYIGGIIKHARALNAFTNPATNSYKRLIPGFEAPVILAYASRNRSAAIRIPYAASSQGRRIEVRFPDAIANPYLAFSAMLMAGLDGIEKKIHPGDAMDQDLYKLSVEQVKELPTVCSSLDEAILHLKEDNAFLQKGNVFSRAFLESYIALREADSERVKNQVHPIEFDMYYSA